MKLSLKQTFRWVGSSLAIAGVLVVSFQLLGTWESINFGRFSVFDWFLLSGMAVVYCFCNGILALAWKNILEHFGVPAKNYWVFRVYGLSQIAKYLPGNIIHLASRQALGMAAGIPGWTMAKSTVWELGLIAVTGVLFVCLLLPFWLPDLGMSVSIFVWIFTMAVVAWLLRKYVGLPVMRAFAWQAAFLVISGSIFAGLSGSLTQECGPPGIWLAIAGAYVVAWLAGLVTPGAPAGVGIREFVLLFLLQGVLSEGDVLLAVLIGRSITVVGDLLFFGIACILQEIGCGM